MAVFRIEKTRDYTVMANHHLRNTALSLKAKGLLSLMLSLPENWDYTTKGLARICRDGVDSICATVKELEEHGYIIRERIRNSKGQLTTIEYTILEHPKPPLPEQEKPERENPVLDNPILEEPEQGNPTQLNTKKSSNQKSITDLSSTEPSNPILSNPYEPQAADGIGMDTRETYREIILENIEYDILIQDRKEKNLIPTKDGISLITVLPEVLTSPLLTAEWEQRLSEIAKDAADQRAFMEDIQKMAAELVATYSHISEDGQKLFAPQKEPVDVCPRCGEQVYEGKKNFYCGNRGCGFVLWKNDRFWLSRKKELTKKMAADLLKKGCTKVKGMYSEKKDTTYDATVILEDTGGKYINFKLEFEKTKKPAKHGPEL